MEIVPGLHQIKTPMPSPALPYVMAYVLEGKDGISLFDTGFGTPAACEAMTARLKLTTFAQISSGSCSAHPFWGKAWRCAA